MRERRVRDGEERKGNRVEIREGEEEGEREGEREGGREGGKV